MMKHEIFYPERAFPDLYKDVMLLHIFQDSKTFADAIALSQPDKINSLYPQINRKDPVQVKAFVLKWFQLPVENTGNESFESLPIEKHISYLWLHLIKQPEKQVDHTSLIYLPHPYVVPGGRFREIYYWDSYFTMLGLRISGRTDVIREMIRNFAWQLDQFGHIPNGNRSYFLSRSQPPFFSLMVNLLSDIDGPEVNEEYLPQLLLEYSFWMDGIDDHPDFFRRIVKVEDGQYLNRYYDDSDTPRTESYAEDVELWNDDKPGAKEFYRNIKAACESGWDFSSRWFGGANDLQSIRTLDIIPPDLNSLIYILERTIARSYHLQGESVSGEDFDRRANMRAELMQRSLWNEDGGFFTDLIFKEKKFGSPSLAMMFPLYAGIATPGQAERTIQYATKHFLKPGGWVTSNEYTGQQWDAPNGWAPLQWITYEALKKYGANEIAEDAGKRWLALNENVFNRTGRMMEKYNVEDLSLDAGGGEYPVQDGFGWTNGVYLALRNALASVVNSQNEKL
ncbi:MAG TPA: alpha,alpha-trehalase TreF [Saprospiraceae bacterium]|nr:alpha,alpha-trehalase TreF [Saprospiraceae bacterium]